LSLYVVDASAGIKWFVPEIDSDAALRLQDPAHQLHVPSLFDVEVANTFTIRCISRWPIDSAARL
jgi:predicted nucleic acid-binding protein